MGITKYELYYDRLAPLIQTHTLPDAGWQGVRLQVWCDVPLVPPEDTHPKRHMLFADVRRWQANSHVVLVRVLRSTCSRRSPH
eukprot:296199-Chlamydomonas_euryale.AAC.4